MGNFINTNFSNTIDQLVEGAKKRLDNPYYIHADRKPTVVTYYSIDTNRTTTDLGTGQLYDQVGVDSPLRFNKILNFHLYGIEKIGLNLNLGEYGMESPVEGEAIILPNTIVPMVGDMFSINHINNTPILFGVTGIGIDTLPNGANFYKIQYYLARVDNEAYASIEQRQTINTYEYRPGNVGTTLNPLIVKDSFDLIKKIEACARSMRSYYINLFYRHNVQTFILSYNRGFYYDPYMIEFLIRNHIFSSDTDYMHINRAVYTGSTFDIEYDRSIFKNIEDRNPELFMNSLYEVPIEDPTSLLVDRLEEYTYLSMKKQFKRYSDPMNWFTNDLQNRIMENKPYSDTSKVYYKNIIIEYLNNKNFEFTDKYMNSLRQLDYTYSKELFYEIPVILYILKSYVEELQKREIDTNKRSIINSYNLSDSSRIINNQTPSYITGD